MARCRLIGWGVGVSREGVPGEVTRHTERPTLARSGVWGALREVRNVGCAS